MTDATWTRGALVALIALLTSCGATDAGSAASSARAPTSDGPPAAVAEAFCGLLEERARLEAGELAAAYHAAQMGELDEAASVSSALVIPALAVMADQLDVIEEWEAGRAFADHARPLVGDFSEAASEFVANPTDEAAFDRADAAGQALRDELFDGEFARVGVEVFEADCG